MTVDDQQACKGPTPLELAAWIDETLGMPLTAAVGHVMKRSNGRANPSEVAEYINRGRIPLGQARLVVEHVGRNVVGRIEGETPMRDPNRIDKILADLARYWRANPDLRLGQIVSCLARDASDVAPLFYIEDDVIGEQLAEQVAKLLVPERVPVKGWREDSRGHETWHVLDITASPECDDGLYAIVKLYPNGGVTWAVAVSDKTGCVSLREDALAPADGAVVAAQFAAEDALAAIRDQLTAVLEGR